MSAVFAAALALLGVAAVGWAARHMYRTPRLASTEPWTRSTRTADDVWNDAALQRLRDAIAADKQSQTDLATCWDICPDAPAWPREEDPR